MCAVFTVGNLPRSGRKGIAKHLGAGLAFLGGSSILRALAFQGDVTISAPNGVTADLYTGKCLPDYVRERWW